MVILISGFGKYLAIFGSGILSIPFVCPDFFKSSLVAILGEPGFVIVKVGVLNCVRNKSLNGNLDDFSDLQTHFRRILRRETDRVPRKSREEVSKAIPIGRIVVPYGALWHALRNVKTYGACDSDEAMIRTT